MRMVGASILDKAHLCGRAAHVERNHVISPHALAIEGCADRASRWSRLDNLHRVLSRSPYRGDTAAGEHDVERALESYRFEPGLKPIEIAAHERLHVCVAADRAGTFE